MTLLSDILNEIIVQQSVGNLEIEVSGLAIDSRRVDTGYLFAAIRGSQSDGHDFITKAIENGATAILCEELPANLIDGIGYIVVGDSNEAMAFVARAFYGFPAEDMRIVGITGTNGKTTVATLGWQLSMALGIKAGLFSTVDVRIGDQLESATHTTPDFIQLYARLREMKDAGCKHVFMEVSSHALHQNRTAGLQFDVAVFTNATRDHLDYHGDFKSYLNAKKLLFDGLDTEAVAIVCQDDKHASYMVQNCAASVKTYGLRAFGDIHGRLIENTINGLTIQLFGKEIAFRLTGAYNAQNLLAVYGIFESLGFEQEEIMEKWSGLRGAEGRFDLLYGADGEVAIVDYAHTPDALKNVLTAVDQMRRDKKAIITVVGAGGDRDAGKRPLMAQVATGLSDITILTSDNPRSENPDTILEDMFAGVSTEKRKTTFKIVNREEAIKLACQLAKAGDIILVAGKGHEKYQEINGEKFPFDDKQVLQQYLSES